MTTYAMKPAPMPAVIEYVNGISTIVRNAGIAISESSQAMSLTWLIIRKPTSTSAGTAASLGMCSTSGTASVDSRNSTPVTTDARPVRAPSPTPEADSMYDVLLETPAAPPAAAAIESTIRIFCAPAGVPSASLRPASAPIAVIVPIVSKKSASRSVKTSSAAVTTPARSNPLNRLKSPSSEKSGLAKILSGQSGTLRFQPLEVALPPLAGRSAMAWTMPATIGRDDDADQDRAGYATRVQRDHQQQAEDEHQHGPAGEVAADAELDRRCADAGRTYEAGVDEADERDEQADAHRDRGLELAWHGVEHRFSEAGQHEDAG